MVGNGQAGRVQKLESKVNNRRSASVRNAATFIGPSSPCTSVGVDYRERTDAHGAESRDSTGGKSDSRKQNRDARKRG
jgi:hypothetical protein